MENSTSPHRILYGIGKAIDRVPEWHARGFLKLYDKLYTSKLTGTEKAAADAIRPIIEKRAKTLGWIATGLEATVLTYLTAKGFSALKNKLKGTVRPDAAVSGAFSDAPDIRVGEQTLHEIRPSGTIFEREGILHIQEGEEAIHTTSLEGLMGAEGGSVVEVLDTLLKDASDEYIQKGNGADIVTCDTFWDDSRLAMVNLARTSAKGGVLDYLFNIFDGKAKKKMVVRIRQEGQQNPLIGYLVSATDDGTMMMAFVRGEMPSDTFTGKWLEREGYTPEPLTPIIFQRIRNWMRNRNHSSTESMVTDRRINMLKHLALKNGAV